MFEVVGIALQIILAFAGVTISLIEILREKRILNEQKEKKKRNTELVTMVNRYNLENKIDKIRKHEKDLWKIVRNEPEKTMKAIEEAMIDLYSGFISEWKDFLTEYGKVLESIRKLYKQMLLDEDNFSFSYGFERYINGFRSFLVTEKYLKQYKESLEDFEKMYMDMMGKIHGQNFSKKDHALTIMATTRQMLFIYLNNTDEYRDVKVREAINGNIIITNKIIEAYPNFRKEVEIYFESFKKVHLNQMILFASYDELRPLLEEIKIKYDFTGNNIVNSI